MKKIYFTLFVGIFFIVSCSVTQEYHFNNNFSGTANTSIDISIWKDFMKNDSTGEEDKSLDSLDQSLPEIAERLKKVGAKNINFGWKNDKTVLFITYDFDDVNILNKTLSETGTETDLFKGLTDRNNNSKKETPKFSIRGKRKLIYSKPNTDNDSLLNNSEMESMKEYFQYSLLFSFDRKIKKVANKNAKIDEDMKSFGFSGSMFEILSPDYSTDFTVKLKRK